MAQASRLEEMATASKRVAGILTELEAMDALLDANSGPYVVNDCLRRLNDIRTAAAGLAKFGWREKIVDAADSLEKRFRKATSPGGGVGDEIIM